jgi:hypothetical protein
MLPFVKPVNDSLFVRRSTATEQTNVAVATDDMAIAANTTDAVWKFKKDISQFFDITDLGEFRGLLNFEIRHDRAATIPINQPSYIEAMANKFGLQNSIPICLPMLIFCGKSSGRINFRQVLAYPTVRNSSRVH